MELDITHQIGMLREQKVNIRYIISNLKKCPPQRYAEVSGSEVI